MKRGFFTPLLFHVSFIVKVNVNVNCSTIRPAWQALALKSYDVALNLLSGWAREQLEGRGGEMEQLQSSIERKHASCVGDAHS